MNEGLVVISYHLGETFIESIRCIVCLFVWLVGWLVG